MAHRWLKRTGPEIQQTADLGSATQKTTQKILELITANPTISRKELAAQIGITADGLKYHLTTMQKKRLLKRIGPDKGGHWEILNG
ncbi:MAG: winged helix-turn-helix transcriptional regulator [Syntrophales bacterium]